MTQKKKPSNAKTPAEIEKFLPFKQALSRKYKIKLSGLIARAQNVSISISDSTLANEAEHMLGTIGFICHNHLNQGHAGLLESIIVWLMKDHLILLHYRPHLKDTNIINLFSALKMRAPYSSNESLLPIFFDSPSSKRQMEVFRTMAKFNIRFVFFLTPNASTDKNMEELLEQLHSYGELSKKNFELDESVTELSNNWETEKIKQYKTIVKRADELMDEGNYEEAINSFTAAIEMEPSFTPLIKRGDAYYKTKQYVNSLNDYREAQLMELSRPDPFAKIGSCCIAMTRREAGKGNGEKAGKWFKMGIKSLEKAEKLVGEIEKENSDAIRYGNHNPYSSIMSALIDADLRGLDMKEEEERVNELTSRLMFKTKSVDYMNPKMDIDSRIDKAIMLTRTGFYEDAEKLFRDIIDRNIQSVGPVFNNFAVELRKNGRNGKAFEIYLEIMKYDIPDRAIVVRNMVTAGRKYAEQLRDTMKSNEAVAVYKNILHYMQKSEGKEWVLCDLSMAYLEMQNQVQASASFMEAIYINPNLMEQEEFREFSDLRNLQEEMVKKLTRGAL